MGIGRGCGVLECDGLEDVRVCGLTSKADLLFSPRHARKGAILCGGRFLIPGLVIMTLNSASSGVRLVKEMDLCDLARQARIAQGLTQREAAERLDVRQPSIAKAESGSTNSFRTLRLRMIEAFGSDHVSGPYWLLTPTDSTP